MKKDNLGFKLDIQKFAEPTPEPTPAPEPAPQPEPTPEPVPQPAPAPQPTPEPAPQPTPEPIGAKDYVEEVRKARLLQNTLHLDRLALKHSLPENFKQYVKYHAETKEAEIEAQILGLQSALNAHAQGVIDNQKKGGLKINGGEKSGDLEKIKEQKKKEELERGAFGRKLAQNIAKPTNNFFRRD